MRQMIDFTGMLAALETGSEALDYLFGLSTEPPDVQLDVDWSRLRGFCSRWAAARGVKFGKGPAALSGNAVSAAAGGQADQVRSLAASLAASDQRVAALQSRVAELESATPSRDQFVHRFGEERGGQLFAMGVKSIPEGERIFQTAMSMGSSFGMARAALAQKAPK